MSLILLILFLLCFSVQVVYWVQVFGKLGSLESSSITIDVFPPVSIVICAKNEFKNLTELLPLLVSQDYPQFEIIVINDHSKDDTGKYLSQISAQNKDVKYVNLTSRETDHPGKKIALRTGIESAKYDYILTTDADCRPNSNKWIRFMASTAIRDHGDIVLGYSPTFRRPGWLNYWIGFETIFTAIQYLSYAILKKPYMGVGRNMLYKKGLFDYEKLAPQIASGDDDLLVQSLEDAHVSIQICPNSFMFTESKDSFLSYYRQKTRHISTAFHYKPKDQWRLMLFSGTHIAFWLIFWGLIFLLPIAVLAMLVIKWVIQAFIFNKIATKLQEQKLVKYFPLFDFSLFIYYVMLAPNLLFGSRRHW